MPKGLQGFQKGHLDFVSPEARKRAGLNISKAKKGKPLTLKQRKALQPYWESKKGKTYANLGKKAIGWKGGKIIKCETCGKLVYKNPCRIKKHNFCSKKCAYVSFKGQHHSPKSEFKKGQQAGKNHYQWKGGITPEHNRLRGSEKGREWIKSVFIRDNWTCQKCGFNKSKRKLSAHHIQGFSKYKKLRFKISNGITFCRDCHKLFHKIYGYGNNTKEQVKQFLNKV